MVEGNWGKQRGDLEAVPLLQPLLCCISSPCHNLLALTEALLHPLGYQHIQTSFTFNHLQYCPGWLGREYTVMSLLLSASQNTINSCPVYILISSLSTLMCFVPHSWGHLGVSELTVLKLNGFCPVEMSCPSSSLLARRFGRTRKLQHCSISSSFTPSQNCSLQ